MYMDQAKRKLAEINGYKDSQELCDNWGIPKVSLFNIFYRNRGEDKVEQLFLPKVLEASKDEHGGMVAEFIRNHVPSKKMPYPTIDVWDMSGSADETTKQKADFIFENDSWVVVIKRKKVPERLPDGSVTYVQTKQEKWDMRLYHKG